MTDTDPGDVKQVKKPRRRWRMARSVLRVAVVVYLAICVLVYFGQDRLAFPGRSFQGSPEAAVNFGVSAEILHLTTSNGIPITAVFGTALDEAGLPKPSADHCPTIIYFYGNAGGPVTRLRIATADHNTIFTAEPETVWPALQKWLDQVAAK